MKLITRSLLLVSCILTAMTSMAVPPVYHSSLPVPVAGPGADSASRGIDNKYKAALDRVKLQAASISDYAKANNYSTDYVFLIDMSVPSGKNRFFVYNLKKDAIEAASLVSHGIGSNNYETNEALQFSNEPSSLKTSIGKYKIGKSYTGRFGLAYKLYGLDATNSKAYERDIVLHAHQLVPDRESFPAPIVVSAGCPTVSTSFLSTLGQYIRGTKKPILMWIYH